jgi:hypothetical protein
MGSVKKVAIVGFDVLQQQPVKGGDLFKIATHQSVHDGPKVGTRTELAHVAELYDVMTQKLKEKRGFIVLKQSDLIANPAYAAAFKAKTDGWQARPLIPEHYELYQAPKVLDTFAFRSLTEEEKKKLQQDLKVDALVIVQSRVDLNMSGAMASLVGKATMEPSANSMVTMIDASTGQEIWNDTQAKGEPVKNSERLFLGMADDNRVNNLAKAAIESSYNSAFERLKPKAL